MHLLPVAGHFEKSLILRYGDARESNSEELRGGVDLGRDGLDFRSDALFRYAHIW